ncbi:hypothetical protein F5Y09DRAFT_12649 [Xylaria sp. FL1042]|nr:hypothetical protein F5Y09DRAFT_12649 [Xylaria sp. FL1042]
MFMISPHSHLQTAIQPLGALPKTIAGQQHLYKNQSTRIDSFETLTKPTAFPNPPRPPTPGPPRPFPPVPPHPPGPTPPPTPPPSVGYVLFYRVGPQLSILVSGSEPSQCPYPVPPPSPGPRRPGPVGPRPDVPTPPPSPRRSINPWSFSTASSLVDLALACLSLATWDGDTVTEYVSMATEDDIYSERHSSLVPNPAIVGRYLLGSWCQQTDPEISRSLRSRRELDKQDARVHG